MNTSEFYPIHRRTSINSKMKSSKLQIKQTNYSDDRPVHRQKLQQAHTSRRHKHDTRTLNQRDTPTLTSLPLQTFGQPNFQDKITDHIRIKHQLQTVKVDHAAYHIIRSSSAKSLLQRQKNHPHSQPPRTRTIASPHTLAANNNLKTSNTPLQFQAQLHGRITPALSHR